MKSYQKILKEAWKLVKPSKEEAELMKRLSKKVLRLAKRKMKKYKGEAILAGSITRDTWLPDKLEFDVFLLFPERMKEKRMEELGLKIGKSLARELKAEFTIEYAQHPYASLKVKGVEIDVVPCYKLESLEKIKSAVDRTPFHVKYLEKKLKKKYAKEVRLLKKFLKVNGIYGAEAKVQGFSGYVCELLIIHYKGFLNLLKNALKWEPGMVIDLEKYYSKKDYRELRKRFRDQVLILIDPTDKHRNAAAALAPKNFFKFKKLAKEFLENPSLEFFKEKEEVALKEEEYLKQLRERETEILVLKFSKPKVVDDVLYPQLRKFNERISNILKENEFIVTNKDFFVGEKEVYCVYELEVWRLPRIQKRIGPNIFDLAGSKRFIEKYKPQAFALTVEKFNWIAEVERKFKHAKEKLKDSLEKPLEILLAKGIPSWVAKELSKGFELKAGTEVLDWLKDFEFAKFLRKFFKKEKLC